MSPISLGDGEGGDLIQGALTQSTSGPVTGQPRNPSSLIEPDEREDAFAAIIEAAKDPEKLTLDEASALLSPEIERVLEDRLRGNLREVRIYRPRKRAQVKREDTTLGDDMSSFDLEESD